MDEPRRIGWIASHYLSYVRDNSLWIPSGPIDGGRFAVTAGVSSDFSNSRFDSYLVTGDWRHYFRLGKQSAWALRGYGFYSGGDRPRRVNIGGTLGLRGLSAVRLHRRLRGVHVQPGGPLPAPDPPHARARRSAMWTFPEIQGGLFTDLGKARFSTSADRALLGSYGISFRMALGPLDGAPARSSAAGSATMTSRATA